MKHYYGEKGITIYCGDCREVLPDYSYEEEGFCIVTDPPYGRDVAYSTNGARIKGDSNTELRDWCVETFPLTSMLIFNSPLESRPKNFKSVLIWNKSELTGMGDLEFPWKLSHEEIYVFEWEMQKFETKRRKGSILNYPLRPAWTKHPDAVSGLHPNEKPLSLMTHLVSTCPAATLVLDPFMGSGTTLRAAKDLGRRAIGIEIEEKYCEIAAKRLSQEVLDFSGGGK